MVELEAIEAQWLPRVRAVWDLVSAVQRADAEAFEAAIASHFKRNPSDMMSYPESNIPPEVRAQLKRFSAPVGRFVPDAIRKTARQYYPARYDLNEETAGWCWDDADGYCYLDLWSMEQTDCCDPVGWVAICPLEQGGYTLEFRLDLEWSEDDDLDPEDLVFQTMEQAKSFLDGALACNTPPLPPQPSHWED